MKSKPIKLNPNDLDALRTYHTLNQYRRTQVQPATPEYQAYMKVLKKVANQLGTSLYGNSTGGLDSPFNRCLDAIDRDYPGWRGEPNPVIKPLTLVPVSLLVPSSK